MKKMSLKSFGSMAIASGAVLALAAGGLVFSPLPASASSATLTLSGSGLTSTSATGNGYIAQIDLPSGESPSGAVIISDEDSASVCTSSTWSNLGTDGFAGELFDANCTTTGPESGGDTIRATFSDVDYALLTSNTLTVDPGSATLTLVGSPIASATGNSYNVTLDASTDVAPSGVVTVTDTDVDAGLCTTTGWTDAGPDTGSGELYTAGCAISTNEVGGDTVSATYSGPDYAVAISNDLVVDAAPDIAGATITGAASVGDVLTAGSTTVTGAPTPTASYQWLDNGVAIAGATSQTYTVQSSDLGNVITVTVTETNGVGDAATATSTGTSTVTAAAVPYTPPATTTPTTPVTLPVTPPVTPPVTTPDLVPAALSLGFSANSATLGVNEYTALRAVAKKLKAGARVTIIGYAKGNAKLARARAEAAAACLKKYAHVTVTIHVNTSSANKVTVATTKN
jgi:outer membrane protein OmpA-like peptidoglycan-associated protein